MSSLYASKYDEIVVTTTGRRLMEIYGLLLSSFGLQGWWPADSALEMMVGAILTQNTNWNNVEKAIRNLREHDLLSVNALSRIPTPVLAEHIRPSGYYNIKSIRLKNLITFIENSYGGAIEHLFSVDTGTMRNQLLSVKGIGLETADSIILYGAGRALFVVDTYTFRVLVRHGLIAEDAGYHDLQELFMDNLPQDVELFKEFHALIVKTGKDFCRKNPLCSHCPLNNLPKEVYG